jgi:hypothetical protein
MWDRFHNDVRILDLSKDRCQELIVVFQDHLRMRAGFSLVLGFNSLG